MNKGCNILNKKTNRIYNFKIYNLQLGLRMFLKRISKQASL